jgi:hypothetical protein
MFKTAAFEFEAWESENPERSGVCFFFFLYFSHGVGLSPLGTAATSGLLYKPQMMDEGDCGAIGGMRIGRGNRRTRRKPAPVPLCPPQIPHDLTLAQTFWLSLGGLPDRTMNTTE